MKPLRSRPAMGWPLKIDYVDITEDEFNQRMNDYKQMLTEQFAESHRLENEIMEQLNSLRFNS